MLNKYLQAGIGLAASLLTTHFLVQTAQATELSLSVPEPSIIVDPLAFDSIGIYPIIFNPGSDPIFNDDCFFATVSCDGRPPLIFSPTNPAASVPEPLTIIGASAAIAFGAGFKRRKKQG
ncbi:MAG: PEP-CTERM sorting domain-containing protein [Cyanobacteriota bacterium]|jgi:hypothetical protein